MDWLDHLKDQVERLLAERTELSRSNRNLAARVRKLERQIERAAGEAEAARAEERREIRRRVERLVERLRDLDAG